MMPFLLGACAPADPPVSVDALEEMARVADFEMAELETRLSPLGFEVWGGGCLREERHGFLFGGRSWTMVCPGQDGRASSIQFGAPYITPGFRSLNED